MIESKKVIGITLARGGSKSIPSKNLAVVNKKSLLNRAIDCAQKSKYLDQYFVSSDSDEILFHASLKNVDFVKRPAELCEDNSTSSSGIEHLLSGLCEKPDYIVEIMCTSPFKTTEDLDAIIRKLHETQSDSIVGVKRIYDHHPSRVKYVENDILHDFYPEKKESRRQDLTPHAYVRNGSLYAFTYESFIKYQSRYGGTVRPYLMDDITSINIDEPNDLVMANIMGERYGI